MNARKRSSISRTSVYELTRTSTPILIPSTPNAGSSRPFPHLTGAGSIPLNARPLPHTKISVRTTVRALLRRPCLLANVSYITERDISLPPAAITQPPGLYTVSGPGRAFGTVAAVPKGTQPHIDGTVPSENRFLVRLDGYSSLVWTARNLLKTTGGSLAGIPRPYRRVAGSCRRRQPFMLTDHHRPLSRQSLCGQIKGPALNSGTFL